MMVLLFVVVAAVAYAAPAAWLVALPALLPAIDLAPWSGWLTFEEVDLLILAVAAGGYARLVLHPSRRPRGAGGATGLVMLVALLFAGSVLLAMLRGFDDAGGFSFGWYQGYREPMNSARLGKCFLEALLLLPVWTAARRESPERTSDCLSLGLMLGLGAASLATLWERVAFTGLLNFSTDYRTTALFWEMHVGGAALDGFLALTMPFALRELLLARTSGRWIAAAGITLLGAYACLTTFSRGVYLAIPVGAAVMYAVHGGRMAALAPERSGSRVRDALWCLATGALFAIAAFWMFPTSGYRGMLALLGAMALLLPLASLLARARLGEWLAGLSFGMVLALLAAASSALAPKAAYAAYALGAAFTLACLLAQRRAPPGGARLATALALAGWIWVLANVGIVAAYWGGEAALWRALPVIAVLVAVAVLASRPRGGAWPAGPRWQGSAVATMVIAAGSVAAFGGGAYMTERFSTSSGDLGGREQHWKHGLAMLHTPADFAFGKGLGRFFDNFFQDPPPNQRPGDYRLHEEGERHFMTLVAGTHMMGWGELLRLAQRVAPPTGPATVRFEIRAEQPAILHFDVCSKHLLYDFGCLVKQVKIDPRPGVWQTIQTQLDGEPLSRGAWYAPKLTVLSVSTENADRRIEIGNLVLAGADGRNLLSNGDFSDGMAHWFFTSDRSHLPWHIKNMVLHVFFEQGGVGLALWLALTMGALWRVAFGHARGHPLAPPLAGALVGFGVVGLFDSLLDVPRVATLFYLLVLIALTLRPSPLAARARNGAAGVGALLMAASAAVGMLPGDARAGSEAGQTIEVGPHRAVKTIAEASKLARDGATVLVDAGTYRADTAIWAQTRLTLRAVGGRARLIAAGASAEGKAIWVMRGQDISVEGFDFEGAAVPDRNGAGIRLERGSLRVVDCSFMHNEMGLLTSNDPETVLEVVNSEFAHNLRPDGHNHNLYAGTIKRLSVTGSYFHHATTGHLLKSRAALSEIRYNRLTDEADGRASYELEFPNGGIARVVGNIIQQGPSTENEHLISFGAEGYRWAVNEIDLVHNTLIDDRVPPGVFMRVKPGATKVRLLDNLLVGAAGWNLPEDAEWRGNVTIKSQALDRSVAGGFRSRRLLAPTATSSADVLPMPSREYRHPRQTAPLTAPPSLPGAMQTPSPP
ncbi:hypothetical protein BH11PSE8_BH11PSE8_06300 [soil metagenome]